MIPRHLPLMAAVLTLALAPLAAPAQVLVVEDRTGSPADTNTWTIADQIAQLKPQRGELVVVRDGHTVPEDLRERADMTIVLERAAHAESNGDHHHPPLVTTTGGLFGVPFFAGIFGDDITDFVSVPEDPGQGAGSHVTVAFQQDDVRISRSNRRGREVVAHAMATLGMVDDLPGTGDFLPPAGRVGYALYDTEGTGASGSDMIERIVNGMDEAVVMRVCPEDLHDGVLGTGLFHSVLFPGGSGRAIGNALEELGRENVTAFIAGGGGYVGICAGAYFATCRVDNYLGLVGAYHGQPWAKGGGMVDIELSEEGKQVLGEEWATFQTRYNNGPVLVHEEGLTPEGDFPEMEVWAWFRSAVKNRDGILSKEMVDTPAIVASTHGEGRILIISPHPESHPVLDPMMHRAFRWTIALQGQ